MLLKTINHIYEFRYVENGLRGPLRATCGSSVNRITTAPVSEVQMECCGLWSMVHIQAPRSIVATITWMKEMYRKTTSASATCTDAWFQASAGKWMKTTLFWTIKQRVVAIYYWRFGTSYWPIGCPETSVVNYHWSLRSNSEQRSPQNARISYVLWHGRMTLDGSTFYSENIQEKMTIQKPCCSIGY